jgi:hypothetical protein
MLGRRRDNGRATLTLCGDFDMANRLFSVLRIDTAVEMVGH